MPIVCAWVYVGSQAWEGLCLHVCVLTDRRLLVFVCTSGGGKGDLWVYGCGCVCAGRWAHAALSSVWGREGGCKNSAMHYDSSVVWVLTFPLLLQLLLHLVLVIYYMALAGLRSA